MTEVAGKYARYPEPPQEGSWADLQRYASTRLLADMIEADDKLLGLLAGDPVERWARAEAMWERLHADG